MKVMGVLRGELLLSIKTDFETPKQLIQQLQRHIKILEVKQQKQQNTNQNLIAENERMKIISDMMQEESDAMKLKCLSLEEHLKSAGHKKGVLEVEIKRLSQLAEYTTNIKTVCIALTSFGLFVTAIYL